MKSSVVGRNKRDVLAYPHHIKNYMVNPFKESDWANFWEQVEYDWDTEDFKYARQETVSVWETLQKHIKCFGAKHPQEASADHEIYDNSNNDRHDFEQIPNRKMGFLEKLKNTFQDFGSKLSQLLGSRPTVEERDVLAYPYHIKNYQVNPFKETDRNNFWEQVKYDWDTEEFEWLRQEIGKGWEKLVSAFKGRPSQSHIKYKVRVNLNVIRSWL